MNIAGSWASALAVLTLTACVFTEHVPYTPDPAREAEGRPAIQTDPIFEYPRRDIPVSNHTLSEEETEAYWVRSLSFPSIGENGQKDNLVNAVYYQSKTPGKKKLVIVLPIWGSYTYPSDTIAAGLVEHGRGETHVVNFLGKDHVFDWAGMEQAWSEEVLARMMKRMALRVRANLIDMRRLIDWAETRDEIDAERIGVIGFSHSGIYAALLAVQEPRVAATALVVGLVNPHLVIANCIAKWPSDLRKSVLKKFSWTQKQYEDFLEPIFRPYDPARYPGRADPARVILFDAYYDECVTEGNRDTLWELMGRPERHIILDGHGAAFLAMTPLNFNWMRDAIYEFFDRTLDGPEGAKLSLGARPPGNRRFP
ncbi:MAG: dienelactone hydrolase family protein [Kiloniellales bacterium]|nr:dienelactone hydrolase family protein [Kiloniellales bacterium]